jgi:hypothetical protein
MRARRLKNQKPMKTNSVSARLAVHARTIASTRHLIFRRVCLWTGFLAFATIAFGPHPAEAAVTEAWVQHYGSEAGSQDYASKVVTDAAGNVIGAGSPGNQTGGGSDMNIIKYSGAGVPLWTNRYKGPVDGYAIHNAVAVDGSGNVVVTGRTDGFSGFGAIIGDDYYTAKYAAAFERAPAVTGPWSTINTQTAPASGLLEYLDTTPHLGSGFYRIFQP